MRKMLSGNLTRKIKNLFQSIWSDCSGNVEIGKNLMVDGQLKVNHETDIVGPDGVPLFAVYFHLIQINGTSINVAIAVESPSRLPADSPQDLTTLLGTGDYIASGLMVVSGQKAVVKGLKVTAKSVLNYSFLGVSDSLADVSLTYAEAGVTSISDDVYLRS